MTCPPRHCQSASQRQRNQIATFRGNACHVVEEIFDRNLKRVVILRSRRSSAGPRDFKRSAFATECAKRIAKAKRLLLLLWLIRRAHVLVTQIPQHLPVFFAHSARKIWIVQVPVARGLRHILQHAQPLLNGPLSVRRQLLPFWQHVIPKMVLLLWRKLAPILGSSFHLLLPLRRQLIEPSLIFRQATTLLRTHVPQTFLHIRRWNRPRLLPS